MAESKKKQPETAEPAEPAGAPPVPDHIAASLDPTPTPASETPNEDPVIDEAVDDITKQEADQVLAADDEEIAKAFEPQQAKTGLKAKIANFFKAWWHNPKARYGTIFAVLGLMIVVGAIPQSRYFVLNNVGVRSSATVVVIDESTQQPLKNVEVKLSNQVGKTDSKGVAKIEHLKLGSTELVIQRRAFAPVTKKVTVGWGSNPYGNFSLKPTGSQYSFLIVDFMSDKPINKAEVSAGEETAVADEEGNAVLTIDPNETSPLEVTIKAEGYRDEAASLNLDDKSTQITKLVPSHKHSFVSKRSGKLDLYSIDVDGKNEQLILPGSGSERDDITLAPHPADDVVAITSTRDNTRNKDGYLLTNLNIVNTRSGEKKSIAQSENIQIVDWVGNRLVFVQIAAGASANNPNRMRLISYDYANNVQKELASSNYFNDVVAAAGSIYYAPSDNNPSNMPGFYKTNAEGTDKVNLLAKSTWNIFRTKYDRLTLSVGDEWFEYKLGDKAPNKLGGAPASQQNRVYQDDSSRKQSLWVDTRDGKGVLMRYDTATQEDTVLRTQSGLTNPAYWLNDNYAVYRIKTDQETADYVINLGGGNPRKISDVTSTNGLGNWYFY